MSGPVASFRPWTGPHSAGWIASLLLHSTLVFWVIIFTQQLTLAPQPTPFKWIVAMVEPMPSGTEETSAAVSSARSVETSQKPVPSHSSPHKPAPALTSSSETSSLAKPARREGSRATRPTTPAEAITAPSAPEEPVALEQSVVRSIEPAPPPIHSESAPISSSPHSLSASEEGMETVVSATSSAAIKSEFAFEEASIAMAPNPSSSAIRQDYSWLSETILRRVEELKRYPSDARLDRAEGKVVLKAVIRGDGSVGDLEISQSSGYRSLDHAALELLKRAAPFQLPRPLGKSQMTVKIPMNYRLEP